MITFEPSPYTSALFSAWSAPRIPRLTMKDVLKIVCAKHGVSEAEVMGLSRVRYIARARQEFMYRAYQLGHLSLPQIGRFLGRDHSTVLHGIRAHRARMMAA